MSATAAHAAGRIPLLMGVINVTPDSFSDGGDFQRPDQAIERIEQLIAAGADVVDLGAESTRPGATPVDINQEWSRLQPVLKDLAKRNLPIGISIDTRKPEIMLRAADFGATWFNDIGGTADREQLSRLIKIPQSRYLAMHMPMTPDIMQASPMRASAAIADVANFFCARHNLATEVGFSKDRVWLDPGIGFGKTDAANLHLMQSVGPWSAKWQIMIGVSRKSLLGRVLGIQNAKDRDPPSKMLEFGLGLLGASLIRTHDVAPLKRLFNLLKEESDG